MTQIEQKKEFYNVVFEGRGDGKGNYKGVRTIIPYRSWEQFLAMQEKTDNSDIVVAAGVSSQEAQDIAGETPIEAYVSAAVQEAMVGGELNGNLLRLKLNNLAFVRGSQELDDYLKRR